MNRLFLQLMVLLFWVTGFFAARLLEYAPHASLWFPPAAISFAALIVYGARIVPSIAIACILGTILVDLVDSKGTALSQLLTLGGTFALTHVGSNLLVALPMRRLAIHAKSATSLAKVSLFLLGSAVATGIGAGLGVLTLFLGGEVDVQGIGELLSAWWIGDFVALLALAPFMMLVFVKIGHMISIGIPEGISGLLVMQRDTETRSQGKLALMLGMTALILFVASQTDYTELVLFLLFIPLLIQLWIVHTENAWVSVMGVAAFALITAVATAALPLESEVLFLKFLVISLAASSYLGLAVPTLYSDNTRLRSLLTHDVLTGAMNRAFFEDFAQGDLVRVEREGGSAVLIMIDLDDLKSINDAHGHAEGDQALADLVAACEAELSGSDRIGRLSGDEFAIYLPGQNVQQAAERVEAIKRRLSSASSRGAAGQISASFGWVQRTPEHADFEVLLAAADQAMYSEKRQKQA
ncbi:MAG: diguanylate cyclase [Pseudomonadota bacterium]